MSYLIITKHIRRGDTTDDIVKIPPAKVQVKLFLQVTSYHRYEPRYTESATPIIVRYTAMTQSLTHSVVSRNEVTVSLKTKEILLGIHLQPYWLTHCGVLRN